MKAVSTLFCRLLALSVSAIAIDPRTIFRKHSQSRPYLSADQVRQELGGQVSDGTLIFGPDDARFANATSRWSDSSAPHIQVVIIPATETDVSTIIKYSNQNSIRFLAVNRGHGWTSTLRMFNGIQIDMKQLTSIEIEPDGKSAWFGGGAYDGEVSRYLWAKGYVATTGACDCVGMLGPGLGGGFGRHGGIHGLISDNLVQLNVVLANGEAVTVNSTSLSDLLWGMKGAGHNFGIVTSFQMNIFPRGPDTWHYHNYVWRGDKLEAVFEALNDFAKSSESGTTPVNMTTNWGFFTMNTTITSEEPIIWWSFAYRGSAEEAEALLAPFNAIESAFEEQDDVPYPTIAVAQQSDEGAAVCQHGSTRITATTLLKKFNITAERRIYDSFQQRLKDNPKLAAGASILQEGYSNDGVTAYASADSAYPWRSDVHLNLVAINVDPANKTMMSDAREWAGEIRGFWLDGQPGTSPHTYVNYANGFEPLSSIYGDEPWRLERLKGLKEKYDPNNAFRYYNPIIREHGYEDSRWTWESVTCPLLKALKADRHSVLASHAPCNGWPQDGLAEQT